MATRAVKTSCKNTKVRSASGSCVTERPTMKKGGSTKSVLKKAQIGGSTNRGDYDINTGMNPSSEPIMQSAKKGGTSPFGILSIIAGIDNNPKPTAADRISGAKMKNKKMAKGGTAHPGFKAVQSSIAAKQGISKQVAGAILASSARKASAKAKAKNPRLKKVK
jgi:hypothetical protein